MIHRHTATVEEERRSSDSRSHQIPSGTDLTDEGNLVEWEEENNIRIVTSSTWDEFTYFAGGHGDVVSMGTQEIPVLENETSDRDGDLRQVQLPAFADDEAGRDPYETLADIPTGRTSA